VKEFTSNLHKKKRMKEMILTPKCPGRSARKQKWYKRRASKFLKNSRKQ
jgi:hypothetical protein